MKKLKKATAVLLALIMLCSVLPVAALADAGIPESKRAVTIQGTGTGGAIDGGTVEAYYYYDSPSQTENLVGDIVSALITGGKFSETNYQKFVGAATKFTSGGNVPVLSTIVLIVRPDATHDIKSDGVYYNTDSGKAQFALAGSEPGKVYVYTSPGSNSSNSRILVEFASSSSVTITAAQNGTVSCSNLRATAGQKVTITAKPDSGYTFSGKSAVNIYCTGNTSQIIDLTDDNINAKSDGSYEISFTMPDNPVTVTVSFDAVSYFLSFASELFTGGKITVKCGSAAAQEIASTDRLPISCGEIVTVTATPDEGFQLTGGKLDAKDPGNNSLGAVYFSGNGVTYTLAMPAVNVNIVGGFASAKNLSVSSVSNAIVTVQYGDIVISEGSAALVVPNSDLKLLIKPEPGFAIDPEKTNAKYNTETYLTPGSGLTSADGGFTFKMPGNDTVVTAGVSNADYTIGIQTNAAGVTSTVTGDATPQTLTSPYTDTARYGNSVQLVFTPPAGKDLERCTITYTDNGATKYITPTTTITADKCTVSFKMPSANVNVNVQFGSGKTLNFDEMAGGTITAKSAGALLGTSTLGAASSATLKAVGGTQVELYPTASAGYTFVEDSINVRYMNGSLPTPITVNYDSVGDFYFFTMPSASSVTEVSITATFAPRLHATLSKIPTGGKAEIFRTSDMTNDNRIVSSSATADIKSDALLKQNDVVFIYVTPEAGFSVKDISVAYSHNGIPFTMTTSGTVPANTLTLDTTYSSATMSRYYFTMPAEDVTVSLTFTAPLIVTGVKRTSDTAAEISFTSAVSGTYYYVKTSSSDAAYSDAAIKTSSPALGGTGIAMSASSAAAEPVLNKFSLSGIDINEQYIFIVVQDSSGNYSNVAKATVPKVSRAYISNGTVKYSLDYDISDTVLTIKSILDSTGANVTDTAARAISAVAGKAIIDLTALGTVTDVQIPYSIAAALTRGYNNASKITALETNFSGYGINIDSDSLPGIVSKLKAGSTSYLYLGMKAGEYSTLTPTQKTYIDEYSGARVLIPRIAYINGTGEPITRYTDFDGNIKIYATHKIAENQIALGVTGFITGSDGYICQASGFSFDSAGYVTFNVGFLPNSLIIGYWSNPFPDIESYAKNTDLHWAFNAVKYNEIAGLFKGMDDGTFSPVTNMNMAQLVTVLYRVRYGENPNQTAGTYWYSSAAKWAIDSGVIAEAEFTATASVTREQFITMFYKTLKLKDSSISATNAMRNALRSATDYTEILSENIDAIAWAVSAKLISGTTSGSLTIAPKNEVNRIQVCQMLKNYYTNIA